jgi:hypothetical protein
MRSAGIVSAAAACYAANCALGGAVALRLVDTTSVHWVHHALYIGTATLTAAGISASVWSRSSAGWTLLPAAVPLAMIPYVSTTTGRHTAVALSAAPFFVASLIKAWR